VPLVVQLTGAVVPPVQARPAGQGSHRPWVRKRPAGHVVRLATQAVARTSEVWPVGQLEQEIDLAEAWNVLRPQGGQLVCPPVICAVPGEQSVHAEERDVLLKVPLPHKEQLGLPDADVKKPGVQSMHEVIPVAGWLVPGEQAWHAVPLLVPPRTLPNQPEGHGSHLVEPMFDWKKPIGHCSQLAWP
jgi:hypothetical protein